MHTTARLRDRDLTLPELAFLLLEAVLLFLLNFPLFLENHLPDVFANLLLYPLDIDLLGDAFHLLLLCLFVHSSTIIITPLLASEIITSIHLEFGQLNIPPPPFHLKISNENPIKRPSYAPNAPRWW